MGFNMNIYRPNTTQYSGQGMQGLSNAWTDFQNGNLSREAPPQEQAVPRDGLAMDTVPTVDNVMGGFEDYKGVSDSDEPPEDTRNDDPLATGWRKYASMSPGDMPTSPIAPISSSGGSGGIPQIAPIQQAPQGLMQSQASIPQIDRPWLMG